MWGSGNKKLRRYQHHDNPITRKAGFGLGYRENCGYGAKDIFYLTIREKKLEGTGKVVIKQDKKTERNESLVWE